MSRTPLVAAAATAAAGVGLSAHRLRRLASFSGVDSAQRAQPLPGDDLVGSPTMVIDRAVTLAAPADVVWPWLVQLGKERAGWYLPAWLEYRFLPERWRGLRRLEERWQHLELGEDVPDWGPGDPVFRVAVLQPGRALVYLSLRDRGDRWAWPSATRLDHPDVLALSWALTLRDDGDSTVLQLRLRARTRRGWGPMVVIGGLFDWITVRLLFTGLSERLADTYVDIGSLG